MVHNLKCHPEPFEMVRIGVKRFEIRYNDRGYQVGDILRLYKHDPQTDAGQGLEGIPVQVWVTYILEGGQYGLEPGYIVMGIVPVEEG